MKKIVSWYADRGAPEKWDADEMNQRRRAAERFARGDVPVTRNELLEVLDAMVAGNVLALVELRRRWSL